jgi:NTE family protein/lysophospholipid hydrolase
VLLHAPNTAHPSGTSRWLDPRAAADVTHHHVRTDREGDVARLARSIGGASLGLALSGGGARGFAQLGVIRALADFGLSVDVVGGASMGAVLGALHAIGHDVPTIVELMKAGHRRARPFRDFTAPVVSLLRGDSLVNPLKMLFGDTQIEDLWIPFFCVSANLSRAELVVHDRGPVWRWLLASASAPGVVPPVVHHGDLLVDGGVLNNLPADILRERCRGSVIAVDVAPRLSQHCPNSHPHGYALQHP